VFMLDADLQDPPELLPEMMARMDAGYDVVYGQRIRRAGEHSRHEPEANENEQDPQFTHEFQPVV